MVVALLALGVTLNVGRYFVNSGVRMVVIAVRVFAMVEQI
jgi:hypothetical protein